MSVRRWLILAIVGGQLIGVALVGAVPRPSDPTPTVAFMQLALRTLGYDPGPIDGLSGRRTISALTTYAQDRQIVLNRATAELVVTLLIAEASKALDRSAPTGGAIGAPRMKMLPVYQW
jgi:peptidoglycan hydrolase-like protein with peptidoglycan-binding domain